MTKPAKESYRGNSRHQKTGELNFSNTLATKYLSVACPLQEVSLKTSC